MKNNNIFQFGKSYTILLCILSIYSVSLIGQAPITELSGFLELYPYGDSTSVYIGVDAGQQVSEVNKYKDNTFVGSQSGKANTSGEFNSFFGYSSGSGNTTGSKNSFFGYLSGYANETGRRNSFFGHESGIRQTMGSDNSFFGHESGRSNVSGRDNSFFGKYTGYKTVGHKNSFFGSDAGFSNTTGQQNSFFGVRSGYSNGTSSGNSFFGANSGEKNTAGNNSFFGSSSGVANTDGISNSFFGTSSGYDNVGGDFNSFFGASSGFSNEHGDHNSFFGNRSGSENTFGHSNSFFGTLTGLKNTVGRDNSFFGSSAGRNNITGSYNSFFGDETGRNITTQDKVIALGYQAGPSDTLTARSNRLYIDVKASDDPLIYGEFDNDLVRINGELHLGATNYASGGGNDDGVIRSPRAEGADIFMIANDGIFMLIGDEESEFGTFEVWNGTNNVRLLKVEEDGDTQINGDLDVTGTINGVSDINRKSNFEPISPMDILSKISDMPITKWQYKGSEEKHIGPMAQDFYAAFGLGQGETTIATVDADGIALAGIQALNHKLENQNRQLIIKNEELENRIQRLESLLLEKE